LPADVGAAAFQEVRELYFEAEDGEGEEMAEGPAEPDPGRAFTDWLNKRLNGLEEMIEDVVSKMLEHDDDRVTILGMVHSAVMHGFANAGFDDDDDDDDRGTVMPWDVT